MSSTLKAWIESVHLHPDVLKEHAGTDIFALDLGPLAEGTGTVAPVYRDAETFFRASYITTGLRSLLEEVLKRLAGKGGAPVLKLMTPFGGDKSHTMAALLHAAKGSARRWTPFRRPKAWPALATFASRSLTANSSMPPRARRRREFASKQCGAGSL